MSWPRRKFIALFGAALAAQLATLLTGCGYRAVSGSSGKVREAEDAAGGTRLVLDPRYRRLFISEVDNPTVEPIIGTRLRNIFRDEITRRGGIEWVERGQARGLVKLRIQQFSDSARVRDDDDRTVKFQVTITASARIVNPDDNATLFDSGLVSLSQSYFGSGAGGGRETARERVVELCARRLADRLADAF